MSYHPKCHRPSLSPTAFPFTAPEWDSKCESDSIIPCSRYLNVSHLTQKNIRAKLLPWLSKPLATSPPTSVLLAPCHTLAPLSRPLYMLVLDSRMFFPHISIQLTLSFIQVSAPASLLRLALSLIPSENSPLPVTLDLIFLLYFFLLVFSPAFTTCGALLILWLPN